MNEALPTTLQFLKVGARGKVIGFQKGSKLYRHKLLAMGLTPGTEFTLTRKAPLGDPCLLDVRGSALTLRKYEANNLLIEILTS